MSQAKSIYTCKNCSKEYSTENQTNFKSNKFCCKECLYEYNKDNKLKIYSYCCEYCGIEFIQKSLRSSIRFCSFSCSGKYSNLSKEKRQELTNRHNPKIPYNCENCGKLVEVKDWFKTGRFCCDKCAKSFSGKQSNKNGNVTKGLNEYIKNNNWQSTHEEDVEKILKLSEKYSPYDMQSIVNVPYQQIKKVIKEYNIDYSHYVRACNKSTINLCKNVLKKDTSITYEDVEKVKEIIHKHIFDDNIPPQDIAVMYNYTGKPETFSAYLTNCLHMKLKTLSEAVVSYNERIGLYDNKTEKELYYLQCDFKFSEKIYPFVKGYELLEKYNWYNQFKNWVEGLVKDHRLSKISGYLNKINPKLISHPANCEFMLQIDNSSKKGKCSITIEELKEQIKEWDTKYGIYNKEIYDEHLLD